MNIQEYLNLLRKSGFPLARINQIFNGLDSLAQTIKSEQGLEFPTKKGLTGTGLSQFALKLEPAGKVRVFALLDSITQTVLSPVHNYMFDILRKIPNDGTFNQDAAVVRATEKHKKYGISYSFDLSSATDRLPRKLTSAILESLVKVPGYGDKWEKVIADREFSFSSSIQKSFPDLIKDQDNKYRYSVGQPMGGLSSWAGLALTHHWILQFCSPLQKWEERYEILGDDIVIFDTGIAMEYLRVMTELGVEINPSKSISSSRVGFEFAKRTVLNGINVSAISMLQILSSVSLNTRVSDTYDFVVRGLVSNVHHLSLMLRPKFNSSRLYDMKEIGLATLSYLNLLSSKEVIEFRIVLESLVNPKYWDFD